MAVSYIYTLPLRLKVHLRFPFSAITLASGFDLLLGRVVIQIPILAPAAEDYTVTREFYLLIQRRVRPAETALAVYGDSSNVSPEFEMLIQGS